MGRRNGWSRILACACLVGSGWLAPEAPAQSFPTRIVKLVVPQAPGGTTDVVGRAIAARLGEIWKQNVVVENIVGASGNLGSQHVAQSAPDGYTLLMAYEGTHAMNPNVLSSTPFDPVRDFTAIATVARAPFLVVARRQTPITSFRDFLALARDKPDALTYGSAGIGSANHLIGEMLKASAQIRVRHVPYRGAPQAITDVMGGQIDVAVASLPSVIGQVSGGELKPLAISSATRSALLPDVPTVAESGVIGFDVTPWWGILGPARMDPQLRRKIADDINAALLSADLVTGLRRQGAEPFVTTSDAFTALMEADLAKWAKLVKQIELK